MSKCVSKRTIKNGQFTGFPAIFVTLDANGIDCSVSELVDAIRDNANAGNANPMVNLANKTVLWLVFDGDDPLGHQDLVTSIMSEMIERKYLTPRILFKTYANHMITEDFAKFLYDFHLRGTYGGFADDALGASYAVFEINLNVTKIATTPDLSPDIFMAYARYVSVSYYVVEHDGGGARWYSYDKAVEFIDEHECAAYVFIKPTSDDAETNERVAAEALDRGLCVY